MKLNQGEKHLVEWQYGMAGGFFTTLFNAMNRADRGNFGRLALGFPEEAEAMHRFMTEEGYWESIDDEIRLGRMDKLGNELSTEGHERPGQHKENPNILRMEDESDTDFEQT